MEKELIICDTNIFINMLNRDKKTIQIINKIGLDYIAMTSITEMELLQGMGNKLELQKMQKTIKQFHIIDFTKEVSSLSVNLISKFSLSHNLQIPDAIIGATAITFNLPLFTYNVKDFKFMPNIRLFDTLSFI